MFTFAGKHLTQDFGLRAKRIERSLGPEIEAITEKIPGRRGVSDQGIEEGALEIRVPFSYQALNVVDLRAHLRLVWAWLRNGAQLGKLVFDDEPDKTYIARVVGLTELEEIIARSQGEITFLIPDPDALGEMDEQRIAGLGVGKVDSTPEDFAEGVLSSVTTETRAGQTDLILKKYGGPYTTTINSDWGRGTLDGMMEVDGKKITLERGEGAHRIISTTAGWNDVSARSNTKGDSNKLILGNIPTFYMQDDLSAYRSQGWNDTLFADTRKGTITQQSGYMRLNKTGTGNDSTVMVFKNRGIQALDRSVLLYVRTTTSGCRFQFVDDGKLWNVWLPNTGDEWTWFRIDYADLKTATLYELGNATPISTISEGTNTTAADRFAFILGDAETGRVEVDAVYYGRTATFPALSVSSLTGYSRYQVPLDAVGFPRTNSVSFTWEQITGTESNPQTVQVMTRFVRADSSTTPWQEVASGGSIPSIFLEAPFGPGDILEVEVRLTTTDLGYSPEMSRLKVDIDSSYKRQGSWKMSFTDFRYLNRVIRSKITFDSFTPADTSIEVLATWTTNGETHGPFPCTSGNPLPYLTNRMDVSDATLEIEIQAATEDNSKSPEVSLLKLEMDAGYCTDTDAFRIAPGVDLSAVQEVQMSRIWWEEENPDPVKCSIRVYAGYAEGGPWTEVANGGEIPGASKGDNVEGKTLYVRTVLRTSDPALTPRLQVIGWEISQETKTDLINEGTAPADAIFHGTFSYSAKYFQILHIQSGRRITLHYPFEAGDEVEIDGELYRVRINGSARDGQTAMDFSSRWMEVHPGFNSFDVSPSGVGEFFCKWRERWL